MGRSITVFWDEGKLGSLVMLFYLLLFSLLSFPVSPTDSMANWASCLFITLFATNSCLHCKSIILLGTYTEPLQHDLYISLNKCNHSGCHWKNTEESKKINSRNCYHLKNKNLK